MSSYHHDAVVSKSTSRSTMHCKRALSASYALCIIKAVLTRAYNMQNKAKLII